MKCKLVEPNGKEIVAPKTSDIENFLKRDFKDWKGGAGDSALECDEETLIVFKVKQGVFIMTLSQYTAPLIQENQEAKIITHYVGGEPMDVPDICLCDEKIAFKIISFFIENNGALHPDFEWVNIFDFIEDRYSV